MDFNNATSRVKNVQVSYLFPRDKNKNDRNDEIVN